MRHLEVASLRLKSLNGLEHVAPSLETLSIADTLRTVPLDSIRRLEGLRQLYLNGHREGIEIVGELGGLERLTLRSITLPDLAFLRPLERLSWLELHLGGTNDLDLLPEVGQLRNLEIWRVRGLSNLESLASLPYLERLHLQSMGKVLALPSLDRARSLRRIALESMKGVSSDLAPIAAAPALEDLFLVDMGHLQADAVMPFVGHRTLRSVVLGLRSRKKSVVAAELLPLPCPGEFRFSHEAPGSMRLEMLPDRRQNLRRCGAKVESPALAT